MKVVVVASGDVDRTDVALLDGADLVIAADGGAARLDAFGHRPDLLVGDLDSADAALVDRLVDAGTLVERHPADKEASDSELALQAALTAGATETLLLGGIGGRRVDHALANALFLADPELVGRDVRMVHAGSSIRCLRGSERLELGGDPGDLVSLLPVGGDATGIVTEGLRWALLGETLRLGRSRGLSNEIVAHGASVGLEAGTLLVVETRERGALE